MKHLVVGSLHEGGVNGRYRFDAFRGQPRREGHRVLFRDAHVEEAFREAFGKQVGTGAFRHGCRDGHDGFIFFRQFHQGFSEDAGVGRRRAGLADFLAGDYIEGSRAVEFVGPLFRGSVAFAFFGDHMDQDRALFPFGCRQHGQQRFDIMAVHGAEVFDAQVFEYGPGGYQVFHPAFHPVDDFQHIVAVLHVAQPVFQIVLQFVVGLAGTQLVQVL